MMLDLLGDVIVEPPPAAPKASKKAKGDPAAVQKKASQVIPIADAATAACDKLAYVLPGNPEIDVYIIPVSGGADSSKLAIMLHEMFPGIPFRLVFTDPGAEDAKCYEALTKLEQYLGKQIERVMPERDLWQLLEDFGNFLPSSQDRWCTRLLKAEPFKKWLAQFEGQMKWIFVGIRADETQRVAFTLDGAHTEMPFVDMGLRRKDVFNGLQATVGVPEFYSRRSRSGCSCCPFQRRQERIGLLQERPQDFLQAAACEKLTPEDLARHGVAPDLGEEVGISRNWLSLPAPRESQRLPGKLKAKSHGKTIFGDRGVYVGAEFFLDWMPGYAPFVWKRRLVSYSSSLAGIKRQLNMRYAHLLSTAEAHDGMDEWDVRHKVRFAVYYIEAGADVFDPQGPGPGSYTWHAGESYRQIAHVVGWAFRVLAAHEQQLTAARVERAHPLSWLYEHAAKAKEAMAQVQQEIGRVLGMEWYEAKEPDIDDEFDERFIACPMCSV